jgi:hypothetical protein
MEFRRLINPAPKEIKPYVFKSNKFNLGVSKNNKLNLQTILNLKHITVPLKRVEV